MKKDAFALKPLTTTNNYSMMITVFHKHPHTLIDSRPRPGKQPLQLPNLPKLPRLTTSNGNRQNLLEVP